MKALKYILQVPRNIAITMVCLYQKTFSPDHSRWMKGLFPHGHCRHTPSCSEYAKLALKKHGFIIGLLKSLLRVCRCNPWGKGGMDLP